MSFIPHFDLPQIIQAFGYIGLFGIIFAETGLFLGFFLPGDSLLFTAGLLSSQGLFSIWVLAPLVIAPAILGDSFGYWFGAKVGPKIFNQEDSLLFHKRHIERTREFYAKYGAKAVFLARFIPIVRTFIPILAGVGGMPYKIFVKYNIIGGFVWGGGMTILGYSLGKSVPGIDKYLTIIIIGIIIVSFLPIAFEFAKDKISKK
ncbi:MAG: VTT domain-containing protein [Candidatus Yonathbacteria bacterium]|nr:VTT domain-containing protein [Candidatus Yonathbacteria bacterium]